MLANSFSKKAIIFLICIIIFITFIFFNSSREIRLFSNPTLELGEYEEQEFFDRSKLFFPLEMNTDNAKEILRRAIPVLGVQQQRPLTYLFANPLDLIDLIAKSLVDVKIRDPINIFESELPLQMLEKNTLADGEAGYSSGEEDLAKEEELFKGNSSSGLDSGSLTNEQQSNLAIDEERQASELELPEPREPAEAEDFASGNLVGIYHSHTSESYEDGASVFEYRSSPGERGDIVEVGRELLTTLESQHGIQTVQSQEVTDQIYRESYLRSREVAKELVSENPNLKMLFDIHRDAIATKDESLIRTTIEGEDVARIMLLVTRTEPGFELSHPDWEKNLDFANRLADKMEEMYPGLLRQVKVIDDRRYNQDLHPNTLLLEIGDVNNTLPEAKRSVRLLADVIAALLVEERF
ncbi:stage II sporulation protein P [Fuchsiella alkaliacetigena]|uniref:stage II sporulation protein P n=1 Tax=Fuchsiella alkaliacetigena TaxID=957042 RepID=UPI00200A7CF7|nr:stage II sporulation protein P [Fuchsiella alkaliacetigena]MCK8825143.1 stage II sporulation protein P [Fuchsiella alkaliacetigena]